MTKIGWNGADAWAFEQLIIKASTMQLDAAIRRIKQEHNDRYERSVILINEQDISHG